MKTDLEKIPPRYHKQYAKALAGTLPPRQAIKIQCLECVGWIKAEVTMCTNKTCPLHKYRPYKKKAADR